MSKTSVNILSFIKRNLYYLVIAFALIITAIVILAVLLSKEPTVGEVPVDKVIETTSDTDKDVGKQEETTPNDSEEEKDSESDTPKEPTEPTDTKIVFTTPVQSGAIIKDYTSATVVYNKTLGVYTGHMGIDFSAEAGTTVSSAYKGTVESVTSSYLEGTTVTIDHGNGLKTVYNSIEADENLIAGKTVSAGEVIGTVSDNNRQEYKDGPHLHFETVLNGLKVDPKEYLVLSEK